MIATYNVKVNGRWYRAGEELPEVKETAEEKREPEKVVTETAEADAPKAEEPKPRTSTRRKTTR